MKKALFLIMIVTLTSFVSVIKNYIAVENQRFATATKIVQKHYYRIMLDAQHEKNYSKLRWARYRYQNAEKVVLELGVNTIITNKEKSR